MLDLHVYYVFDVCSYKFYKSRSFCLMSTVFVLDLTNKEIFMYYIGSLEEMCIFLSDNPHLLSYGDHTIRSILLDQSICFHRDGI